VDPLVASRAEDSVVRDLVQEPREVTRVRQQQEILRDLLDDLATVNTTVRDIVRDRSSLDLNIAERRISEPDFHAETAVEAGDETARGLNLKVGVAVRAEQIDVLLRNVRGHVRFRANLDPVLRLLGARPGSQQAPPPPRPDDSP
jgi:hypothetical protein